MPLLARPSAPAEKTTIPAYACRTMKATLQVFGGKRSRAVWLVERPGSAPSSGQAVLALADDAEGR